MAQDLKKCVIQIRDAGGNIRGTGFIIDANTAVTCAHVVEAAGAAPGDSITIAFTLTDDTCPAEVLSDAWSPVEKNDIAILHLQGELPADVKPAILWSHEETAGHSFLAFGYPEIRDDKGGVMKGLGAEGKILHLTQDSQNTNILHIDSKNIAPGMSGSPVLDTKIDRVVGMVTMTYNPDSTLKQIS